MCEVSIPDRVVMSRACDVMLPLAELRRKLPWHSKGWWQHHGTVSPHFPSSLLKVTPSGSDRNRARKCHLLIPLVPGPGPSGKKHHPSREADEQVNTRAETPGAHTIGSERCQLWRLEAWGHAVLETLGPHLAVSALPRPWDCEFLLGKAATSS